MPLATTEDPRIRRLFRNASWLFSGNVLASLCGLLQAIVLARALGASGYGLLAFVMAFANSVNQVIDIRLWESVIRFVGDDLARGDHGRGRATVKLAYLIDGGTGILAFALVAALAPLAAARFLPGTQGVAPYLILYAATLLVATVNDTSMALLRVFDRFRLLGAERVVSAAVRLAALWIAATTTGKLGWVLAVYVAVELGRGLVLLACGLNAARDHLTQPGPDHLGVLRNRLREFWRFTISNVGTTILATVTRQIDVLILTALHGPREVGLYRMAKNFDVLIYRLSDPVYHALFPELVRLDAVAPTATRQFITRSMRVVLTILLPAGLIIILAARPILNRLVGAEFAGAVLPLRILVAGALFQAAFLWARPLALVTGRPHLSTVAHAVGATVMLGASWILVPRYGATGSAIALFAMSVVVSSMTASGALRAAVVSAPARDRSGIALPSDADFE